MIWTIQFNSKTCKCLTCKLQQQAWHLEAALLQQNLQKHQSSLIEFFARVADPSDAKTAYFQSSEARLSLPLPVHLLQKKQYIWSRINLFSFSDCTVTSSVKHRQPITLFTFRLGKHFGSWLTLDPEIESESDCPNRLWVAGLGFWPSLVVRVQALAPALAGSRPGQPEHWHRDRDCHGSSDWHSGSESGWHISKLLR